MAAVDFDVVVEVPAGSRNKYEVDRETGTVWLDRKLFTAGRYPVDYGFVVDTAGHDGDPLDALVVLDEPTFPGCHIHCRAIGMLAVSVGNEPEPKILAVPRFDERITWQELSDVPELLLHELGQFFEIYKDLEPGKSSQVQGWRERAEAESEIEHARAAAGGRSG